MFSTKFKIKASKLKSKLKTHTCHELTFILSLFERNRLELHQMLFQCGYTWATRVFIPARKCGQSWQVTEANFCSVQIPIPLLPWKRVGHETTPATGRHIPLSLSIPNGLIHLKILFTRSRCILKIPNFSFVKREMKNWCKLPFLKQENKGLPKAGSSWGLASPDSCPAKPFHRFLYCHTLCSWCSVQLQAPHTTEHNVLGSFCQRGVWFTCLETERNISLS